jgi:Protein of unknown function (DUF2752)
VEVIGTDMAPRGTGIAGRLAPIACGGALAVAGLYVASNDPSAPGSRFPACSFHQLTGWWCPGCGLTRGTHELLTGDVTAALGHNLFVPLVIAAIAAAWWIWLRRAWDRPSRWDLAALPRWLGPVALIVVVTYSVLRNLPVAPFSALAP